MFGDKTRDPHQGLQSSSLNSRFGPNQFSIHHKNPKLSKKGVVKPKPPHEITYELSSSAGTVVGTFTVKRLNLSQRELLRLSGLQREAKLKDDKKRRDPPDQIYFYAEYTVNYMEDYEHNGDYEPVTDDWELDNDRELDLCDIEESEPDCNPDQEYDPGGSYFKPSPAAKKGRLGSNFSISPWGGRPRITKKSRRR